MIRDFKAQIFCRETNLSKREIDTADPVWIDRICLFPANFAVAAWWRSYGMCQGLRSGVSRSAASPTIDRRCDLQGYSLCPPAVSTGFRQLVRLTETLRSADV